MASERASKKQRELLLFIDGFIKGNNYGPSYREIMRALGYKSVSTVATHVDGLIAKGYLRKADNSARSIQVVSTDIAPTSVDESAHHAWLIDKVGALTQNDADPTVVKTLHDALEILGVTPKQSD
ncbi:MAG: hypothetical protein EOO17_03800 [Chloroflexi bacterium]|nr:MAG: hypothetical protein EOO17_03800 [Chloroflexota bacterium]